MATRAAIRSFANTMDVDLDSFTTYTLHLFWGLLVASVRASGRTEGMDAEIAGGRARNSANIPEKQNNYVGMNAAYSTQFAIKATIPDSSLGYTVRAIALAAASIGQSGNFAFSIDNQLMQEKKPLGSVWHGTPVPDHERENHEKLTIMLSEDQRWQFFHDWYLGMWDGTWADWELAHEVAKIDASIWEAGLDAVAARIGGIEAERLEKHADIKEALALSEATLKFEAVPHIQTNADVLNVAIERVEDALDDVLALGKGNGLTQNTVEALILLRLFRKYRDDPRRVVFDFAEVRRSITDNMDVGEYPKDSAHSVLHSTLTIGVNEICTVEPDLREELERNYSVGPTEPPSQEDMLMLTDAMQVLPEMSEELLARQFGEDIIEVLYGVVVDYENMPDVETFRLTTEIARLSVRRRLASRIAKIYVQVRERTDLVKHYDSDTFKKARVVGTYGGLATFFAALLTFATKLI